MSTWCREHQDLGAVWLASHAKGYLGDVPRLGKTRTLLRAAQHVGAQRPLIVCPAIVRTHWRREYMNTVFAYKEGRTLMVPHIYSYDEITRGGLELMAKLIITEKVDLLIADEAHYCKHASAQRTQMLFGKNGYARRLPFVWPASGTPVSKNPLEFWTILSSVFPEVALKHGLKTADDFKARFCITRWMWARGEMREKILSEFKSGSEAEFREILDEVMLRRTLDDVGMDVPEIDWQIVRLDASTKPAVNDLFGYDASPEMLGALKMYIDEQGGAALEEISRDPHVARMRRRLGELKVSPVVQMLASQLDDSHEKIVVMAHHQSVLQQLRVMLNEYGVAYVDGDVPQARRDRAIEWFQTSPECRVFLGQNIACQTGIDLSAAATVVIVEPDWTGDVNVQLGNRIVQIGNPRRRVVQMIALAGTLDEAIVAQNMRETEMAQEILR